MKNKLKLAAQSEIRDPIGQINEDCSFNYSRILGHPEIINSHHWVENSEFDCKIC